MKRKHWSNCRRKGCTLNRFDESDASVCRRKGWAVGTVVEGDEGYGVARWLITAIGESVVLARDIDRDRPRWSEHTVTFACRCWRKAPVQFQPKRSR